MLFFFMYILFLVVVIATNIFIILTFLKKDKELSCKIANQNIHKKRITSYLSLHKILNKLIYYTSNHSFRTKEIEICSYELSKWKAENLNIWGMDVFRILTQLQYILDTMITDKQILPGNRQKTVDIYSKIEYLLKYNMYSNLPDRLVDSSVKYTAKEYILQVDGMHLVYSNDKYKYLNY